MGPTNIKFVGSPCGQHGPYTFYKAFKYLYKKKWKVLSLGEFFFVKIFKDVEVCIGELQLIWEDKYHPENYLCMVRLYFLPEQTPEGRRSHDGQDEVLMESDKVPFLLEDLIGMLTDTIEWTGVSGGGDPPAWTHMRAALSDEALSVLGVFAGGAHRGLDLSEVQRERKLTGDWPYEAPVIVVNYPQYCRYRTVLRRLEFCTPQHTAIENGECEGAAPTQPTASFWHGHLLVLALGGSGLQAALGLRTRVLFCRDSFEHPAIQEHELRQDHLAPNLRGRPKKKRAHFRKYEKDHVYSNGESDDDSTDSLTSASLYSARNSPAKSNAGSGTKGAGSGGGLGRPGRPPASGANRAASPAVISASTAAATAKKRTMRKRKKAVGAGDDAASDDFDEIDALKIDISPLKPSHKGALTRAEERFLKRLALFMRERSIHISRLPKLGFKEVDLFEFYEMTVRLGGYEQVTSRKLWKQIYDALGGNATNTSAATCTRRHYERMLMQYELHVRGSDGGGQSKSRRPKAAKKRKADTCITPTTDSLTNGAPTLETSGGGKEEQTVKALEGKEEQDAPRSEKQRKTEPRKPEVKEEHSLSKNTTVKSEVALAEAVKKEDPDVKAIVPSGTADKKPILMTPGKENATSQRPPSAPGLGKIRPTKYPNILEQSRQVPAYTCVPPAIGQIPASRDKQTPQKVLDTLKKPTPTKMDSVEETGVTGLNISGLPANVRFDPKTRSLMIGISGANGVPGSGQHVARVAITPPQANTEQINTQPPPAHAHTPRSGLIQSIAGTPVFLTPQGATKGIPPQTTGPRYQTPHIIGLPVPRPPGPQLHAPGGRLLPTSAGQVPLAHQPRLVQKSVTGSQQRLPAHTKDCSLILYKGAKMRCPPFCSEEHITKPPNRRRSKMFFNSAPPLRCNMNRKVPCYENPNIREELGRGGRPGLPQGAGYVQIKALRTPPPAHCNPRMCAAANALLLARHPNNANNSNNRHALPVPQFTQPSQASPFAKRARLVSELLEQQRILQSGPHTGGPPRNPFLGAVEGGVPAGLNNTQLAGLMEAMAPGAVGVLRLPNQGQNATLSSAPQPHTVDTKSEEAPLDLSTKSLQVRTAAVHNLNQPSSPIVISPVDSDEPMNLCVKENVNNVTHKELNSLNKIDRKNIVTPPFKRNSALPAMSSAINSVIQAAASGVRLTPAHATPPGGVSFSLASLNPQAGVNLSPAHANPPLVAANAPARSVAHMSVIQTVPSGVSPLLQQKQYLHSLFPTTMSSSSVLQQAGGTMSLGAILPPGTSSFLTATSIPLSSCQSICTTALNALIGSGGVVGASMGQARMGQAVGSASSLLQQAGGSVIHTNALLQAAAPVLSLASVIRPAATRVSSASTQQVSLEGLSPALASLLAPAFFSTASSSAPTVSLGIAIPSSAVPTSSTRGEDSRSLVLPVSQLVSGTSNLLPYVIPVPLSQPPKSS